MKTIAIYGDSISTGTHGEGGYEAMLKSSLSLEKVYNFAVGSSGLTRKTPGGMLEVLDKNPVPEDAELFLIWHGSNDWYWGSGMEEFSHGVKEAVNRLRAAAPTAELVWVTPIYRFECPDGMAQAGEAYELSNKTDTPCLITTRSWSAPVSGWASRSSICGGCAEFTAIMPVYTWKTGFIPTGRATRGSARS